MSDLISRQDVNYLMRKYGFKAPDMTIKEFVEDCIPSVELERRWIPVTEALPKNYEQTICIDSKGKMMIGMYGEYGWTFPCYMTEPVAWMPLPEPWGGER